VGSLTAGPEVGSQKHETPAGVVPAGASNLVSFSPLRHDGHHYTHHHDEQGDCADPEDCVSGVRGDHGE